MQTYKDKKQCRRTIWEYIKRSQRTPSWARGLLPLEDLVEQLSKIAPRVPQVEDEKTLYIFLSLYPKNFGYSLEGYSHREHWSCTR
jgi:hypothetical protein